MLLYPQCYLKMLFWHSTALHKPELERLYHTTMLLFTIGLITSKVLLENTKSVQFLVPHGGNNQISTADPCLLSVMQV